MNSINNSKLNQEFNNVILSNEVLSEVNELLKENSKQLAIFRSENKLKLIFIKALEASKFK